MVVTCEQVWREVSDYLDHDVDASLRAAIEAHLSQCKHCTAIVDGTRNVIQLYADERLLTLPAGFSNRLQQRIKQNLQRPGGNWSVWMMAAAAAALAAIGLTVGSSANSQLLRTEHSQSAVNAPADLMVTVSEEGKTFHAPACPYRHDKKGGEVKLIAAAEAIREGYSPCVRCMRQYLRR